MQILALFSYTILDNICWHPTLKDEVFYYFFLCSHHHVFFFFPIIFISWRLITLQYCSGFCHTLTGISHGFTCVPHPEPLLPPPSPPHPSGSSQCTSPEHLSHASNEVIFLINLFFNWRIIALQNFAVFCQTSTWISHRKDEALALLNAIILPHIHFPFLQGLYIVIF